jgi:hypothetical protein
LWWQARCASRTVAAPLWAASSCAFAATHEPTRPTGTRLQKRLLLIRHLRAKVGLRG